MDVIILVGISGAGKSTWRKEYLKRNPKTFIVNRDKLRESVIGTLEGYYQRMDVGTVEKAVNSLQEQIMNSALQLNYGVIVDNTNLQAKYLNYFMNYPGVKTAQIKMIECRPEVAKVRVALRDFPTYMQTDDRLIDKLAYIDKQYEQFIEIKQVILENHADKIIN